MQSIKNIFEQFLIHNNQDWKTKLLQQWPSIVGTLHDKMRLERINFDVVIIGVYDSHWMHELHMLSRMIINTMNNKLGGNYVTKLHFRLVEQVHLRPSTTYKQNYSTVIKKELSKQELATLQNINDKELQEALKNFLHRCKSVYDK